VDDGSAAALTGGEETYDDNRSPCLKEDLDTAMGIDGARNRERRRAFIDRAHP
jgi:hypothetical protein